MKTVKIIHLPVTTDRYKSIHLGDGVWRIIDTRSQSKDDQVCVTDSDYKSGLLCDSLNHYESKVLNVS